MLTPNSIKKNNCVYEVSSILANNTNYEDILTDNIYNSFTDMPDYRQVYKNFKYSEPLDVWIYEGNEKDKIVGYKYLQSYPYKTVQFNIGDYIHWNYNHEDLSTWLLISLDKQHLYDVKGRIMLCNNILKWKDSSNTTKSYPCVIEDAMTYVNFKYGTKGVAQQGADIVVLVQQNEDTKELNINERFMFNGRAFKIKQKKDLIEPRYIELYMSKVDELETDNVAQNIANNGDVNIDTTKQGITIVPDITFLTEGQSQQFNISYYEQGIDKKHSFIFKFNDIPRDNYSVTDITNNSFILLNIKEYSKQPLIISCIDSDNSQEKTISIWLNGGW